MLNIYSEPIFYALITFPFVALLFTIPYMIYCYRKFGSLIWKRIIIVYSFILYLMCSYFLIILPLPDYDYVASLTTQRVQLIPFCFIFDIIKEFYKHSTIINTALIQALFNIVLIMPFGMYLRYYFKTSLKKTVFFSFALSLFFELTQLSGLYFIYPRSYRLFDVDDLMLNTFGGYLGYLFVFPFLKILPSRKQIDEESLEQGKKITWVRRCFALLIDVIIISVIVSINKYIFKLLNINLDVSFSIVTISYLLISTIIFKGKTIGMFSSNIKIVRNDGNKPTIINLIIRYLILSLIFYLLPFGILKIFNILLKKEIITTTILYILKALIIFYLIFIYLYSFIQILKNKSLLFETLSKTKIISNIK